MMKIKFTTAYIIFLLSFCILSAQGKYKNGVFILNEDWFGHNNSTINFLNTETGQFDYLLIQEANANERLSLGCTSQFGTIYGDNLYVISKQDQDKGESSFNGGRVVVADAQTMKIKKIIPVIYSINGKSAADGRAFVGVDESKGYIGTSNGIFVFDLNTFEIKQRIAGTENPKATGDESNADGLGPLYQNQIGIMIRTHDYVFAIQQDKGVLVIDPQTDTVLEVIEGCFSTMTQSKDGTIWVGKNSNMDYQTYPYGVFGSTGEKWQGDQLVKINPTTLETSILQMPESCGINQTWYAWTAGSLCASKQHNKLYFTYNPSRWGWFTTSFLYVYDIDSDTFSKIYDTTTESRYFYGGGIRINPLDDKIYASLYLDNINQSYFFYQLNNDGTRITQYEPIKRYWFPALFIFPDNYVPEVADFETITLNNIEPIEIDLSSMATDKDNMDVAITKRIVEVEDESLLNAQIKNDKLILTANRAKDGATDIKVRFNSNGKFVDKNLTVNVNTSSISIDEDQQNTPIVYAKAGLIFIENLTDDSIVEVHDIRGRMIASQHTSSNTTIINVSERGIYIVTVGNKNYKIIL